MYKGTGVTDGIVISKAFIIKKEDLIFEINSCLTPQEEIERYNVAFSKFIENTSYRATSIKESIGTEQAAILEGHILIAQDPEISGGVVSEIKSGSVSAESAVFTVYSKYSNLFSVMDDELMSQRAHDLEDIKNQLIEILTGKISHSLEDISEECIVVIHDMTPSETSRIDKSKVKGVITEVGGITSHMAIMAKAMGLPTVLGVESITKKVKSGETIAVNGGTGEVVLNPSREEITKLTKLKEEFSIYKRELESYKNQKSITLDGIEFEIAANIGGLEDLDAAIKNTAEGIGLFRTEFLFMDRTSPPNEDAQYEVYREIAEKMNGKSVIIRTLDIGGDKAIPYLNMEKEENPFLGYRAIRLCLDNRELFYSQLRAILRASHHGNIKIMLPMITTINELRQTKEIIEMLKNNLKSECKPFNEDIEVGVMIETPAASLIADILAKESDFFSIGTNDLTQYTMAVDRGNEKVQHLYSTFEPAVIRSIYRIIKAGKDAGIMVGMCGEGAGDVNMIPFLLACGLDEFSMSAQLILQARKTICSLSKSEIEKKVDRILYMDTKEEILEFMKNLNAKSVI